MPADYPVVMLLLAIVACAPPGGDPARVARDTAATGDTARDTGGDTAPVPDPDACAAATLPPVCACVVAVDWSAVGELARLDILTLGGTAADAQAAACAGTLTEAQIGAVWSYDAARDGAAEAGTLDLSLQSGAAHATGTQADGTKREWFADIGADGSAALVLE